MIITCLIVVDYDCSNMISDGRTLSTRSSSNFSSFELYLTLMLFFLTDGTETVEENYGILSLM